MKYAKIDDSNTITQYPYNLQKLWVDNPNISFPATALLMILLEVLIML